MKHEKHSNLRPYLGCGISESGTDLPFGTGFAAARAWRAVLFVVLAAVFLAAAGAFFLAACAFFLAAWTFPLAACALASCALAACALASCALAACALALDAGAFRLPAAQGSLRCRSPREA